MFPSTTAILSRWALECCHWGWDVVCWLGLLKEALTKAQAAGYSTLTGYLAHPWVDTQPVPGSQRWQWFCTLGPFLELPNGTKSDIRSTQKFDSFLRHV